MCYQLVIVNLKEISRVANYTITIKYNKTIIEMSLFSGQKQREIYKHSMVDVTVSKDIFTKFCKMK